ncbi:acyltransferase family protein [Pseudidiomarina homiensis]|uniref:acyltransferase family protein n=1 Tax=Pseudidiomarina homiensis TaxID=364198 RepID=UPI00215A1CD8|nr:acyltransferase [Pseudidiomarina homiensis]
MKYRSEVDGLRAFAVLPVILFHAGFELFSGGYVGVDIFFVISGYLITSILLKELAQDKFSIIHFYERRARRILPALFAVMLACIPFAWAWLDPFALKEFFQSLVSTALFSSNIYFFLKTGYFDVAAEMKPLLHTWSLAVEEQYYVIIPIAMLLLWRLSLRSMAITFWLIFIVSLLAAQYFSGVNSSFNFYLLPTRAWELMMGSLVAVYADKLKLGEASKTKQFLSVIGMALILLAIFAFDETTPFPSFYALVPTLGTVLILCSSAPSNWVNKFLSWRGFVGVGLISYSAYLWHQPLLAFYRAKTFEEPSLVVGALVVISTLVLATITYYVIEQPFRNKKSLVWTRRNVFVFSFVGIVAFSISGIYGHIKQGFPERNEEFLRLAQNYGLSSACSGASFDDPRCKSSADPKYILWGDSHAMHLGQAVADVVGDAGVWQMTLSACPPVVGIKEAPRKELITCPEYNDLVFEKLHSLESTKERAVLVSSSKSISIYRWKSKVKATFDKLKSLNYDIYLVSSTPHFPRVEGCIVQSISEGNGFSDCQYKLSETTNYELLQREKKLAKELGIHYVDLVPLFCNQDGNCKITNGDALLLRDENHFSLEAQPLVGEKIRSALNL